MYENYLFCFGAGGSLSEIELVTSLLDQVYQLHPEMSFYAYYYLQLESRIQHCITDVQRVIKNSTKLAIKGGCQCCGECSDNFFTPRRKGISRLIEVYLSPCSMSIASSNAGKA